MNKLIFGISICLLIIIAAVMLLPQTMLKPKPVHYHAGFHVYIDDTLQDFSDFKYMHEKPCSVDGKPIEGEHEDEQLEKAHLHDQVGDVAHVHRAGAQWGDLFTNIKYPIDERKTVVFVNGKKVDKFFAQKIEPYQSVVIFIGKHTDDKKYLKSAVTKSHIQKVEKKSETCSS